MKVCILQPGYSVDFSTVDQMFNRELALMEQCDSSMDIIVMPEACDVPALAKTNEQFRQAVTTYSPRFFRAASDMARRCNALVFANGVETLPTGLRNTTFCFDRQGALVGRYYKQHLTPGEVEKRKMDSDYTFRYEPPTVVEIEGIRFGFLTCYDFYFYENYANLARQNLDVIIGCSHQRSDTHRSIRIMSQFLAYNTNTYVLRASVSMDEGSDIGGGSMVVAPDGTILADMESRIGLSTVDIDVHAKYYKPAGFGNLPAAHYAYIEQGRRPWKYRPAGPAMSLPESRLPYPRVCAHRGFSAVAPENSMPAFGAAVALGAEEIELDVWATADGVLVSCHDDTLERVSNGTGKIYEKTYAELQALDFGAKTGASFAGLRIPTLEEVLQKFSCQTVINLHVKIWDHELEEDHLEQIVALIRKYDAQNHIYFMTANDAMIARARAYAPDIPCCVGWDGWAGDRDPMTMVDRALALGAKKVQLVKPWFNEETVKQAHAHGILCNVFWADDPEEAQKYLEMGIDTILTNDYLQIARVVRGNGDC